jgi:hypothetical protein
MGPNAARPDESVADQQGGGAEPVEQGIERGQKGVFAAGSGGGVDVNQPEKKDRGGGAEDQNGGDGGEGGGLRWGCGRHDVP